MGFRSKITQRYVRVFTLVVCLQLCGSDGEENGLKIFRDEQDIFTNMKCSGEGKSQCTHYQCEMYGAECVTDENCKYCRCSQGWNTFMTVDDYSDGKCKRDEDIVEESAPEEAFWLRNLNNYCLKLESSSDNFIIGTSCPTSPTLDMLWIWTTAGKKQLIMNVKTLTCMERQGNNEKVKMKQCKKTSRLQKLQCTKDYHEYYGNEETIETTIKWGTWLFLHLISREKYVKSINRVQLWNNEDTSCETSTAYKGCYRFSDGSFMKYLNYSEMDPTLRIFAPIFKENADSCTLNNEFTFFRNGQTEKSYRGNIFKIDNKDGSITELKFASSEQFSDWNGTLIKLTVQCREEEHCVLLKLKSLHTYSDVRTTSTEVSTTPVPTPPKSQSSTTDNTYEGISDETSQSGSTNSAAIAVSVVLPLVALALALGFFVWYRRRRRLQTQQNNNNEIGVANYLKDIYEDPDRTYESLPENGNGVLHNQTEPSHDINNHLYRNTIANPASSEQEYTYSQDRHFPRSGVGTNNVVYHTLEQPEQPTDDGTYSYLDNTTTANPPSSELEYTYAKDTDLPSATGTNAAAKNPANNPVYNTLEQPEQPDDGSYSYPDNANIQKPPPELEYTYAKDTDLPRASVDKATKDPTSNAVYHTLEQPEQQPDDGSYSYLDNTSIGKPPPELEYTYAKDTDLPRVNVNQMTPAKDPTSNAMYHTLEQPEQQSGDSYSYPDNTTVTNQGSPELEYTYAKDTDIPRAITDTKGGSVGKSAPINNGVVYHNLEQDEPVPAENEYSYANNTEIPSIDKGSPPKTNALSTVSDNNDLHLTPCRRTESISSTCLFNSGRTICE